MRKHIGAALLAAFGLSAFAAGAGADEEEVIPLDKVPAAVLKAVKEKFPKGELKKAEKETEKGKTTYEVALVDGKQKVEVALKEDGTILEVEKEIAVADLPKPVADALKAKHPKAKIAKAEEITKGKEKSYEVHLQDGGKSREVVLSPAGKVVEEEEDDEDGGDKDEN